MKLKIYRLYVTPNEEIEGDTFANVRFLQYIRTFFSETSMQGLPQLAKQPGIINKFVWFFIIGLTSVGLYYVLQIFFASFLQWQTTTTVSVQKMRKLHFPAVTLCNNNPVTSTWYNSQTNSTTGDSAASNVVPALPTSPIVGSFLSPTGSIITGSPTIASAVVSQSSTSSSSITASAAATGSNSATATTTTNGVSPSISITLPHPHPTPTAKRKKRAAPTYTPPPGTYYPQQQQQPKRQDFSAKMQQLVEIQELASKIRYSDRQVVGHQLCDMVMECEFAGVSSNPDKVFTAWHYNSQFGNCYTFNPGYFLSESPATSYTKAPWEVKIGGFGNNDGVNISSLPGDSYGLYLLLHADANHYLTTTSQLGWRITIHNQTEMPFPEESGVFVAPGTSTRIGISQKYMERLGIESNWIYSANYSNCVDQGDINTDAENNAYSKLLEIGYTPAACLKTCYQKAVMQTCNCFDFLYPNQGKAFSSSGENSYPPCTYDDSTTWKCKDAVSARFQSGNLDCDCPDTCTSYSYPLLLSSMKWPNPALNALVAICTKLNTSVSDLMYRTNKTCSSSSNIATYYELNPSAFQLQKLLQGCAEGKVSMSTFNSSYEVAEYLIGSQFAEVYIYYKDFNVESVVESEWMTWIDMVAYLGGYLGLFFGFTFLTLFEYVQLIVELIAIGIAKLIELLIRRKSKNQIVDSEMMMTVSPDDGGARRLMPVERNKLISGKQQIMFPTSYYAYDNMKPPSAGTPFQLVKGYPVETASLYSNINSPPPSSSLPINNNMIKAEDMAGQAYLQEYYTWYYNQHMQGEQTQEQSGTSPQI